MEPHRREYMDSDEAVAVSGLTRGRICRFAIRGDIPGAAKMGWRWTFNVERFVSWAERRGIDVNYDAIPKRLERKPYVYMIGGGALVKIGFTTNLQERLASLQKGSPEKLFILASFPGGKRLEQQLHAQFSHLREHGEWFRVDDGLAAYIRERGE